LPHVARWNANCIQCHAVAGQARQTEGFDEVTGEFWERYETVVAEEGISCEACHGPGQVHADYYRSPLKRISARSDSDAKAIFVPHPAAGPAGSAACGQCHSYFVPEDPETWWTLGFSSNYRAGQALESSRTVLSLNGLSRREVRARDSLSHDLGTIFWDDGSIMVGGREYNGLTTSPCYVNGRGEEQLSCTHCHAMHGSDPDKQLRSDRREDAMCTTCHQGVRPEHTRHPQDSAGARCAGCHMPRTSYALLHGIGSHQISSPSPRLEGAPHACALCHVDKSKTWIRKQLSEGWGQTLEDETSYWHDSVPWAAHQALSGHAAQRALFAYALGTDESLAAAGPGVARHVLPRLSDDPYSAVRLVAERSSRWVASHASPQASSKSSPLDEATLADLEKMRDNTPITISE
jgi:predicted CXXCH cytochrome family protein